MEISRTSASQHYHREGFKNKLNLLVEGESHQIPPLNLFYSIEFLFLK
jgi:hypothetical protein